MLTPALLLEYEAVCQLAEHRLASGLSAREIDAFLDGLVLLAEPVATYFRCRPQLSDPSDEMVLEAAVNGRAEAIIALNLRHYRAVPGRFGIMRPGEALRRIPTMTTKASTYPLRLPISLKAAVEKLSKRDGTSINQFVVVAVAEKVAAMTAEEMFAERRARADLALFDRIMNREGGEPPRPDDELPPDLARLGRGG